MQRLLLLVFITLTSNVLFAQGVSYTCTRTFEVGCGASCVTITASIPDLKTLSSDYRIGDANSVYPCYPEVDPGSPGPSANLSIDDRYSNSIAIGFTFPFYGTNYNNLVISTNGFVSFNTSLADLFSHWDDYGNLPNTNYDEALIMGPYHDLLPNTTYSANLKVKYNLIGSAPTRKWVLSFYKLPLFSCTSLIENTHQIILHESSGIIEVYIMDKQICTNWNDGHAMIGLQNYQRNKGIMAPNRRMTDAPWGSIGMNEMVRFVPKDGPSAFRSAELIDVSTGNVVATSDTTRIDDNNLGLSFPNVCPPPNTTTPYVVKTVWQSVSDPAATYYSTDTIYITRVDGLPMDLSSTQTLCGQSTGTVTATASGGTPPYNYSIDGGGTYQTSGTFSNLPLGTYTVIGIDANGCSDTSSIDVTSISDIPGTASANATGCPGVNNGSVTVTAGGGTAPYTYTINGGSPQSSNVFTGLAPGNYTAVFTDVNGCSGTVTATVGEGSSITSTSSTLGTSCPGINNGQVTINPTSGTGPYEFSIDGGTTWQSSNVITGLSSGAHTAIIRDASGCTGTRNFFISTGAGLVATITPTNASCAGVDNGSISVNVVSGTPPYQYSLNGGTPQSASTFTNVAAGTHNVTIEDNTGCSTTIPVMVGTGTGITGSGTANNTACPGVNNGSIELTATSGTAPHEFSIDAGATWQSSGTFNGLGVGSYDAVIRDANGCTFTLTLAVNAGTNISATFTETPTACPGISNGTVTITPTNGTAPYEYSNDGGTTWQSSGTFSGLPDGTITITIRDASGCTGTIDATVTAGTAFTLSTNTTPSACSGSATGSIEVTVTAGGTAPFEYSIDGGTTWVNTSTFPSLTDGTYTITVRDANGCTGTVDASISAGTVFTVSTTTTPAACGGSATGSIEVTVNGGGTAPFEYSIDGGTTWLNTSTIPSLTDGTYTVTVRDANGCTNSADATVDAGSTYTGTTTSTPTACSGASTGSLTVTPTGGVAPYEYSIDGGTTWQSSDVFINLTDGTYTITIRDANSCTGTVDGTVAAGSTYSGTATSTPTACSGVSTGTLTVTPNGGTAPYEYSIDGGTTWQNANEFTNLAEGAYTITIRDVNGCTGTADGNVSAGSALTGTSSSTEATCSTAPDGSITITATSGVSPYEYSIDGGTTWQNSNTFNGLIPDTYSVTIRDDVGCTGTVTGTVNAGAGLTGTATQTATSCPNVDNGTITVTPDAGLGLAPFTYSLDGGTSQSGTTFTNVSSGAHSIEFTDANGCTGTVNITVTEGNPISGTAAPVATACTGVDNGSVTISPDVAGSTAPYTYALNGGTAQSANTFNGLAAGNHTVQITDANGCTADVAFTIATGAGFTISATPTDATCPGVANGSVIINNTDGTAPFSYALDGGTPQSSNSFGSLAAGSYSVTTTDVNGCTSTVNFTIGQGSGITADNTPSPTSCPGVANGSVEIQPTNGTAPYTYAINGGTAQASNIFTGLASGNHTVDITDALGCTGSISITISDGAVITGTVTSDPVSCPGVSNGTITVTADAGSTAPYQYALNGGTYQSSNIFNGVNEGAHNVTILDANGCTTANISVTVSAGAPITGVIEGVNTTCPGVNDGSVTLTSATGTAPYTYSLDGGTAQSSNTFGGLAPGTYTITFTDANGCSGSAQTTIGTGSGITSTADVVHTSCPGVNNGTLTITPTSGNTPYLYSLDGGTAQNSNVFTNLAPGTYNVEITDALGCSGTITDVVEEGVDLTSDLTPTHPVCADINNGIIEVTPTSGTAPYTYSLNGGTAQGSNSFENLAPGSYTISFTDAIGCTGSNNITLNTNPPITLNSTITNPLCFGSSDGTITIQSNGGVSPYTYSIDNGVTYQSSGTFENLPDGSYTIRVQDDVSCVKDIPVVLTQPTQLTATAVAASPSTCAGNDGVIEITGADGTAPYTYSIDNGATYPFQSGNTFNVATGTYSNITVKDDNGCTATATAVFVDEIDNMFLEIGNDTTICEGSSVTFQPQTNDETSVFLWTPANFIQDNTIKNAVAAPVDTTEFILHAEWGACSRTDTITVNVKWKPIPDAGEDVRICLDDSTMIHGSVSHTSGAVTLRWEPAHLVHDPNASSTMAVPGGTQEYVLIATDEYGCDFDIRDTVLVIMQPAVPAYAGGDTLLIVNQEQMLLGYGGEEYLWSTPSSGVQILNPDAQNPTVILANDARFFLKVTDIAGCIGFDTVYVQVYQGPEYFVPNAFTPNGDGLNDIFRVIPVGMTRPDYFRVFNRYGQIVFETNQYMKGWDGRYKGVLQQSGTYVWVLKGYDKNGRPIEMKGTVLLIN